MPNWIWVGLAFIASVKVLFSLFETSTSMPRFCLIEAAIAWATAWRTGASLRSQSVSLGKPLPSGKPASASSCLAAAGS